MEWKPVLRAEEGRGDMALKPSLVEWKPDRVRPSSRMGLFLETFLSGMETRMRPVMRPGVLTLKPSLVEWKHYIVAPLLGAFGP